MDNMEFDLVEAGPYDFDEIAYVCTAAFQSDELWQHLMKGVSFEEQQLWNKTHITKRCSMPDIAVYRMVQKSTGRVAAYTTLQYPWNLRPLSNDGQAIAAGKEMEPTPNPNGFNVVVFHEIFQALKAATDYGYYPETDFHQRVTVILPAFRRMGLGTRLTKHVQKVADKESRKIWTAALPISKSMFQKTGYVEVGELSLKADIGPTNEEAKGKGREREKGQVWIMVREPQKNWMLGMDVMEGEGKLIFGNKTL